ncbi:hypothetical protein [Mycolicibacterium celeriflavum]|uniref:MSMEG_1130 family ribosome hibernation factor n=1 Tax=Mycolicibacterium celeriflavum TaxID=1249101 RepID=UPI001F26331E|nr:hypothetical protein [Mycolicibacterium celeriflavum]
MSQNADSDHAREIAARLEGLWPQIESLVSPAASGRGRIAFVTLGSGDIVRLESAMPVANRVVFDDGPFIHPLLELLDESRPGGVVIVSADDARLLEWRAGLVQALCRIERDYVEAPHERAGQIGGGPAGQFHTPMREQRESRERHRTQRFLGQVSKVVAQLAGEQGWERILVSGGERWTDPTIASFPQTVRGKVIADDRILNGLSDAELATAITEQFHRHHKAREEQLLAQMRDAAGSGLAALGLSEVAAALNAGRVAHLVYDPQVRYTGTVGADGAVYGGDETAPGAQKLQSEPRLTERLVERALNTAARITPIEGAASRDLKDAAGIAALLRW